MQNNLASVIFQQDGVALAIVWYKNIDSIVLKPEHFESATL